MQEPEARVDGARRSSESESAASDRLLLLGTRMRDEQALNALYDRYGELVFTLALRLIGDRDLAEAAMQDVFLRCWHGHDQYDEERGTLASWLALLTRQKAIDMLHERQHQAGPQETAPRPDADTSEPATAGAAEGSGLRGPVGRALGDLSEIERETIQRAYFGGLSQTEVAQRLGQAPGAVKARVRDGLRRLRAALSPSNERPASGEVS